MTRTSTAWPTITLAHGAVRAEVVPARGALVTRLAVDRRELLYLDEATLADAGKNVRGGIPLLFPFAGRLDGDLFLPAGTKMKQHGFGRNVAWDVAEQRDDLLVMTLPTGAAVDAAVPVDAALRAQFPYDFAVSHTVRLTGRGAQLELAVENHGAVPLPLAPGWHPYFNCAAADKAAVRGDVAAVDHARFRDDQEFDFGVVAPANGRARFELPGVGRLAIDFAPELRHLQFWSLPGKPFVCIEPFFGPAGTVNTDRRDAVPPGSARCYWMRIELL